jgi:hypothetical protein
MTDLTNLFVSFVFFPFGLPLKGGLNSPMNFSFYDEYTVLCDILILSLFQLCLMFGCLRHLLLKRYTNRKLNCFS